jgi:NADH dehydrogenase [ubiquinone] 1 alpha subcomplex assembly factor 7
MNSLAEIIRAHIAHYGPMTVQDYWTLCLSHPQHGYYIKQDPLGRAGDFVTAPEISQMFGEMIGIWIADIWLKMQMPSPFILVECGAGRGTMMEDLLRATRNIPGLHAALEVHIIETSPYLRDIQKQRLADYRVTWHDVLSDVPDHAPLVILGNEFLDAVPIRQVVRAGQAWRERMIGIEEDHLAFGLGADIPQSDKIETPEGAVFEFSPLREAIWSEIVRRVKTQAGAALMIDYGYTVASFGDTFQAVKNHAYADVLAEPGEADLTSHVNFARLADLAKDLHPRMTTQRNFLRQMGIEMRAQVLAKSATLEQAEELQAGLSRLINADQMGDLFKALAISHPAYLEPAGFEGI